MIIDETTTWATFHYGMAHSIDSIRLLSLIHRDEENISRKPSVWNHFCEGRVVGARLDA